MDDTPAFSGDPISDIPALIQWRGNGLSFVELLRFLPYLRGEHALYNDTGRQERIVWNGVSQQCIDALLALKHTRKITFEPASELTYMCDGEVLVSKHKSKPIKWMPIVLSLDAGTGKRAHAGAARR